ncbi:hypothetical protein BJA5080_05598 [Bradyrhizobium diazoefficiens SEMIA 5080]|uniref:Uncharacterized protein n=1 Tax=Bradyrhizobium diazoefficiens SEMIA 5080 TaxID=754504 RepID=A0A837C3L9_9BRAD|nr:hypothetical protein BJA5080_05598 [Bradyrhizobium diazoefficiens SEMIA 5080]
MTDGCTGAVRIRAKCLRAACGGAQSFRMILDQVRVPDALLRRGRIQRRGARALAHAGENQQRGRDQDGRSQGDCNDYHR